MKISRAIFGQEAVRTQQHRVCSKKPVLSLSKDHDVPVEGWFDGLTMIVITHPEPYDLSS